MMQVDRSVLDRLVEFTAVGRITGPYQYGRSKTHYVWTVSTEDDALAFVVSIFDLLSERRQQQVIAALEAR